MQLQLLSNTNHRNLLIYCCASMTTQLLCLSVCRRWRRPSDFTARTFCHLSAVFLWPLSSPFICRIKTSTHTTRDCCSLPSITLHTNRHEHISYTTELLSVSTDKESKELGYSTELQFVYSLEWCHQLHHIVAVYIYDRFTLQCKDLIYYTTKLLFTFRLADFIRQRSDIYFTGT